MSADGSWQTAEAASCSDSPSTLERRMAYLVRSLELVLELSSHDWHVQPYCQRPNRFPPEGCAFSPEQTHTNANLSVLETFKTYRVQLASVNPLNSHDFHVISTRGAATRRELIQHSRTRLPLIRPYTFRRRPKRKISNLRKDHLEVVATYAKPFEEPCPRIQTPWPGSIAEINFSAVLL
jgi:hypothetical protein